MRPNRKFLLFLLIISFLPIQAQREGDQWVIGYSGSSSHENSIMHLDFSGSQLQIEWHFDEKMWIRGTDASICDDKGLAILWTNGMQIFGKNGLAITDTIANDGDPIGYWKYWYAIGFPKLDGALILPIPEILNEYIVIYHTAEVHPDGYFQITQYLSAHVRLNWDSTYTLINKDIPVGSYHQWYTGTISATRHANGRDWWVIYFEADSPNYFACLLDPTGISLEHQGSVDLTVKAGLGQTIFSDKGNYVARMDVITFDEGQYITLYSFDRCSGNIRKKRNIPYRSWALYRSCIFAF